MTIIFFILGAVGILLLLGVVYAVSAILFLALYEKLDEARSSGWRHFFK